MNLDIRNNLQWNGRDRFYTWYSYAFEASFSEFKRSLEVSKRLPRGQEAMFRHAIGLLIDINVRETVRTVAQESTSKSDGAEVINSSDPAPRDLGPE